jgi:beta-1,4-mannosyl-glycoprotein beta-1,4-N-acetylglucosaminyltransferase
MGKVIDCVIFNDEIKLLELRIKYLSNVVDEFIIFESRTSFSGNSKPLFAENARIYLEKVTNTKISIWNPSFEHMNIGQFSERWPIENETRKQFLERLISERPDDRIIFGDVDEIPSIEQVTIIRNLIVKNDVSVYGINMPTYYKYVNWLVQGVGEKMNAPKTFIGAFPPTLNLLRALDHFDDIDGFGAHLSYLGMSVEQKNKKFGDFSHSEFSGHEKIETFIHKMQESYAIDHIGRYFFKGKGLLRIVKFRDLAGPSLFVLSSNSSYFKDSRLPIRFCRLVASATVTFLRQYAMSDKRRIFDIDSWPRGLFKYYSPFFFNYFKFKGVCRVVIDNFKST